MTAMATEASAAAHALANKRQKDAMGARILETSGKGWAFVKSAPSRFKASLGRLLKTFKLDAVADAAWGFAKNMGGRLVRSLRWVTDLLGFRNLALFAVTHRGTRHAIGDGLATVALTVSRRVAWLECHLARIPKVGEPISHTITRARHWVMKVITKALSTVDASLDRVQAHEHGGQAMSALNGVATLSMSDKVLKRYVPASYRRPMLFAGIALLALRIGQAVYAKWSAKDVETEKREVVEAAQSQGFTVVELTGHETKAERDRKIADAAAAAESTHKAAEKAGVLPGSTPAQQVKKQPARR